MQKALAPRFRPGLTTTRGSSEARAAAAAPRCSRSNSVALGAAPATCRKCCSRQGTLVAWTTQGFPPGLPYKGPTSKAFVPFGVGLVELGPQDEAVIRVEGRLTENDPAKLEFGMPVELTMIPFTTDDDGNDIVDIVTFAFKPV